MNRLGGTLGVLAVGLAACAEPPSGDPVAPDLTIVGGAFPLSVTVCKIADDAETLGDVFSFEVSATGGNVPNAVVTGVVAQDINSINPSLCPEVWYRPATSFDDETDITITEIVPAGYHLDRISFTSAITGGQEPGDILDPATPTVTFKPYDGLQAYFKNSYVGGTGCSLTPGYWKTHSKYGPAARNDTWDDITPSDEDSPFFLSGKSYYEVLWTSPQGGNAYYILAHAYIAAELNFLNGADPTAAQAAFTAATALFNTWTPAEIGALKGNNATRAAFLSAATVLDNYNNGLIGPGHCD